MTATSLVAFTWNDPLSKFHGRIIKDISKQDRINWIYRGDREVTSKSLHLSSLQLVAWLPTAASASGGQLLRAGPGRQEDSLTHKLRWIYTRPVDNHMTPNTIQTPAAPTNNLTQNQLLLFDVLTEPELHWLVCNYYYFLFRGSVHYWLSFVL